MSRHGMHWELAKCPKRLTLHATLTGASVGAEVVSRRLDVDAGARRQEGLVLWPRGRGVAAGWRSSAAVPPLPLSRLVDDEHPDQGGAHNAEYHHDYHNARRHAVRVRTDRPQCRFRWRKKVEERVRQAVHCEV